MFHKKNFINRIIIWVMVSILLFSESGMDTFAMSEYLSDSAEVYRDKYITERNVQVKEETGAEEDLSGKTEEAVSEENLSDQEEGSNRGDVASQEDENGQEEGTSQEEDASQEETSQEEETSGEEDASGEEETSGEEDASGEEETSGEEDASGEEETDEVEDLSGETEEEVSEEEELGEEEEPDREEIDEEEKFDQEEAAEDKEAAESYFDGDETEISLDDEDFEDTFADDSVVCDDDLLFKGYVDGILYSEVDQVDYEEIYCAEGIADISPLSMEEQGSTICVQSVGDYVNAVASGEDAILGYSQLQAGPTNDIYEIYLNEEEKKLYDELMVSIEKIASGESVSTEIRIAYDNFRITYDKFSDITYDSENAEINKAVRDYLDENISLQKVNRALLYNNAYELYWYDKTIGVSRSIEVAKTSSYVRIKAITLKFRVSEDYAAIDSETGIYSKYLTNAEITGAAQNAVASARQVVAEHSTESDYEMLNSYKDYILNAVSYDYKAAANLVSYGDPWQLINVFDDDNTTNVVCEGYSKAFKYLCDLSEFTNDIECILVGGYAKSEGGTPGAHMWNIVRMDDGRTYLVDLTNSDSNSIASSGGLYLNGYDSIKTDISFGLRNCNQECYVFTCAGGSIYYGEFTYITQMYGDTDWMKLSEKDYDPDWASKGLYLCQVNSVEGAKQLYKGQMEYDNAAYTVVGWYGTFNSAVAAIETMEAANEVETPAGDYVIILNASNADNFAENENTMIYKSDVATKYPAKPVSLGIVANASAAHETGRISLYVSDEAYFNCDIQFININLHPVTLSANEHFQINSKPIRITSDDHNLSFINSEIVIDSSANNDSDVVTEISEAAGINRLYIRANGDSLNQSTDITVGKLTASEVVLENGAKLEIEKHFTIHNLTGDNEDSVFIYHRKNDVGVSEINGFANNVKIDFYNLDDDYALVKTDGVVNASNENNIINIKGGSSQVSFTIGDRDISDEIVFGTDGIFWDRDAITDKILFNIEKHGQMEGSVYYLDLTSAFNGIELRNDSDADYILEFQNNQIIYDTSVTDYFNVSNFPKCTSGKYNSVVLKATGEKAVIGYTGEPKFYGDWTFENIILCKMKNSSEYEPAKEGGTVTIYNDDKSRAALSFINFDNDDSPAGCMQAGKVISSNISQIICGNKAGNSSVLTIKDSSFALKGISGVATVYLEDTLFKTKSATNAGDVYLNSQNGPVNWETFGKTTVNKLVIDRTSNLDTYGDDIYLGVRIKADGTPLFETASTGDTSVPVKLMETASSYDAPSYISENDYSGKQLIKLTDKRAVCIIAYPFAKVALDGQSFEFIDDTYIAYTNAAGFVINKKGEAKTVKIYDKNEKLIASVANIGAAVNVINNAGDKQMEYTIVVAANEDNDKYMANGNEYVIIDWKTDSAGNPGKIILPANASKITIRSEQDSDKIAIRFSGKLSVTNNICFDNVSLLRANTSVVKGKIKYTYYNNVNVLMGKKTLELRNGAVTNLEEACFEINSVSDITEGKHGSIIAGNVQLKCNGALPLKKFTLSGDADTYSLYVKGKLTVNNLCIGQNTIIEGEGARLINNITKAGDGSLSLTIYDYTNKATATKQQYFKTSITGKMDEGIKIELRPMIYGKTGTDGSGKPELGYKEPDISRLISKKSLSFMSETYLYSSEINICYYDSDWKNIENENLHIYKGNGGIYISDTKAPITLIKSDSGLYSDFAGMGIAMREIDLQADASAEYTVRINNNLGTAKEPKYAFKYMPRMAKKVTVMADAAEPIEIHTAINIASVKCDMAFENLNIYSYKLNSNNKYKNVKLKMNLKNNSQVTFDNVNEDQIVIGQ